MLFTSSVSPLPRLGFFIFFYPPLRLADSASRGAILFRRAAAHRLGFNFIFTPRYASRTRLHRGLFYFAALRLIDWGLILFLPPVTPRGLGFTGGYFISPRCGSSIGV